MGKADWKCAIKVTKTTDNDSTCKVKVECIWDGNGWSYNINNVTAKVTFNGSTKTVMSSGSVNVSGGTQSLGSNTFTYTKDHNSHDFTCKAEITSSSSYVSGTKSTTKSVSIGARTHYTVNYYGNGNTGGSMSSSTKWFGETLYLSSNGYSKENYSFAGWATSSSGAVAYTNGAAYTNNAAINLYAKWNPNAYSVTYNANGGTGAPGNGTKYADQQYTVSGTKPVRTRILF